VTRQGAHNDPPTPAELGLPEHTALTMEGRIERAGMVGSRLASSRHGEAQPIRRSSWAFGLWLILAALLVVVAVAVIAFLI
jgi:hypothetical protein